MAKNEMVERALLRHQSAVVPVSRVRSRELQHYPLDPPIDREAGDQPRTEPGFREFWRCLRRHPLAFWTVVILITGLAVWINLRARSIYLASTTMVVGSGSDEKTEARDPANRESEAATMTAIRTNLVLMQSHELLEDVVIDLQLDRDPRFLEGSHQGVVDRVLDWGRSETPPARPAAPVEPAAKGALRTAEERSRLDPWVSAIADNLRVEQIGETRALKVSFVHPDPETAAAVADSVTEHFRRRALVSQTERLA